jgi:acetylornithine/N-succinyldiaminopimelate aminotransferase
MSGNSELLARWSASLMDNYGTPTLALTRGSGARVWDIDGREYLDLVGGIAVNALGHAHPAVVGAVSRQIGELGHTSNLVAHPRTIELAERLLALSGRSGRVFFANSGAEANEAALKITRLTGRTHLVAAVGSFHGRTMGALALTGQPGKRDPFRPLPGNVTFVSYGDPDALAAAVDDETAAIFLEPIQGEGGVVAPPSGYLGAAQAIARRHGALFVLDEVQTGIGRTGWWFAHQAADLQPDVMTLAKGLGGGLPIGACVAYGTAADLLTPGSHGSTFGGNPVSAAAALAVLDTIEREGLLARVQSLGPHLAGELQRLGTPLVVQVRGAGLLLGIVLGQPVAKNLEAAALNHGVLVNAIGADVVRIAPALTLSDLDVAELLERWPAIIASVST